MTSCEHAERFSTERDHLRTYCEGPADIGDDVWLHAKYFTYRNDVGLVAGCDFNVMFTIDCLASHLWPKIKDFNLWQNAHDHYYSGVVGDLEGRTFRISVRPNDPGPHQYQVLRVIPENLIVIYQPVPKGGAEQVYLPGMGGVSAGFHAMTLSEHGARTLVTFLMEHASVMELASEGQGMTEEQALGPWRDKKMVPEWLRKWRDDFIPTLKSLVYNSKTV